MDMKKRVFDVHEDLLLSIACSSIFSDQILDVSFLNWKAWSKFTTQLISHYPDLKF